jgi:hypothetical protein
MAAAGAMPGGLLLTFLLLAVVASGAYNSAGEPPVSRRSFPKGFIFGTASSSYQVKLPLPFHSYSKESFQFHAYVTVQKKFSSLMNKKEKEQNYKHICATFLHREYVGTDSHRKAMLLGNAQIGTKE